METNFNSLKRIAEDFRRRKPAIIKKLATEAVNYSKQSFRKESWDGKRWPARKSQDKGRHILMKSGRLRNGVRKESNSKFAKLTNSTDYAEIHNEGGTVHPAVTDKMRKFAWAMYYKTKSDKWKGLALTSKSKLSIVIPKRKFMGNSKQLTKLNKNNIIREINLIYKKHGHSI